jgi:hypothetical protein
MQAGGERDDNEEASDTGGHVSLESAFLGVP